MLVKVVNDESLAVSRSSERVPESVVVVAGNSISGDEVVCGISVEVSAQTVELVLHSARHFDVHSAS